MERDPQLFLSTDNLKQIDSAIANKLKTAFSAPSMDMNSVTGILTEDEFNILINSLGITTDAANDELLAQSYKDYFTAQLTSIKNKGKYYSTSTNQKETSNDNIEAIFQAAVIISENLYNAQKNGSAAEASLEHSQDFLNQLSLHLNGLTRKANARITASRPAASRPAASRPAASRPAPPLLSASAPYAAQPRDSSLDGEEVRASATPRRNVWSLLAELDRHIDSGEEDSSSESEYELEAPRFTKIGTISSLSDAMRAIGTEAGDDKVIEALGINTSSLTLSEKNILINYYEAQLELLKKHNKLVRILMDSTKYVDIDTETGHAYKNTLTESIKILRKIPVIELTDVSANIRRLEGVTSNILANQKVLDIETALREKADREKAEYSFTIKTGEEKEPDYKKMTTEEKYKEVKKKKYEQALLIELIKNYNKANKDSKPVARALFLKELEKRIPAIKHLSRKELAYKMDSDYDFRDKLKQGDSKLDFFDVLETYHKLKKERKVDINKWAQKSKQHTKKLTAVVEKKEIEDEGLDLDLSNTDIADLTLSQQEEAYKKFKEAKKESIRERQDKVITSARAIVSISKLSLDTVIPPRVRFSARRKYRLLKRKSDNKFNFEIIDSKYKVSKGVLSVSSLSNGNPLIRTKGSHRNTAVSMLHAFKTMVPENCETDYELSFDHISSNPEELLKELYTEAKLIGLEPSVIKVSPHILSPEKQKKIYNKIFNPESSNDTTASASKDDKPAKDTLTDSSPDTIKTTDKESKKEEKKEAIERLTDKPSDYLPSKDDTYAEAARKRRLKRARRITTSPPSSRVSRNVRPPRGRH